MFEFLNNINIAISKPVLWAIQKGKDLLTTILDARSSDVSDFKRGIVPELTIIGGAWLSASGLLMGGKYKLAGERVQKVAKYLLAADLVLHLMRWYGDRRERLAAERYQAIEHQNNQRIHQQEETILNLQTQNTNYLAILRALGHTGSLLNHRDSLGANLVGNARNPITENAAASFSSSLVIPRRREEQYPSRVQEEYKSPARSL